PDGLELHFTLLDPRGKTIRQLFSRAQSGIGYGEFALTDDLLSGEYVLQVAEAKKSGESKVLPLARRLTVQRDEPPQLHFDRPHYLPGDVVRAKFRGRADGGTPVPQQPLRVTAKAAGTSVSVNGAPPGVPFQVRTDEYGKAELQFRLPESLAKKLTEPAAQVEVQVHDGMLNERVVQAVPVVT